MLNAKKASAALDIVWSAQEAEIVTGGKSSRPWAASGIAMTIDDVQAGDLFVASPQDDLDAVFERGAAAVMMAHGDGAHPHLPVLKVTGVFEALQGLARAARFRTHANVIAVQGKQARMEMGAVLSRAMPTHMAGRQLSLSLAGLPQGAGYGVFGLSPAVKPDIAVITDPEGAYRDTLFENMRKTGIVLVHVGDDVSPEAAVSVYARAKAAGLSHVYSYGSGEHADARILDVCEAANGVRAKVFLMGEIHDLILPRGTSLCATNLASMLVLKLDGHCVQSVLEGLEQGAQSAQTRGVRLIDPALSARDQAAFRISNMIDLGCGRQTLVLDNIVKRGVHAQTINVPAKKGFAIPPKLANLNFVYTSKGMNTVRDAKAVISDRYGSAKIEAIAPDVLMPGDFLIFKDVWDSSRAALSEALRVVPSAMRERVPSNAV